MIILLNKKNLLFHFAKLKLQNSQDRNNSTKEQFNKLSIVSETNLFRIITYYQKITFPGNFK